MRNTRLIMTLISLMLLLTLPACIHTYPDGEGIDPTMVKVGVEVSVNVNWETISRQFSRTESTEEDFDYRLVIEFSRNGKQTGRCEHFLTRDELTAGDIKLIMPFDFHAVTYKATAWIDCVDKDTHDNPGYIIDDFSKVERTDRHIRWEDNKLCAHATTDLDLHGYKDMWGAKVKTSITLTPPIGRFMVMASDIEEFRDYINRSANQEETYSVCIAVEGFIPTEFMAYDNKVEFHQDAIEYYFPMPETGNVIASGAFFADENGTEVSAKVLVYNSARLIVSKSPTFQIPIYRGRITSITGSLMTDYYTNSINVNTAWDGEIIIEL